MYHCMLFQVAHYTPGFVHMTNTCSSRPTWSPQFVMMRLASALSATSPAATTVANAATSSATGTRVSWCPLTRTPSSTPGLLPRALVVTASRNSRSGTAATTAKLRVLRRPISIRTLLPHPSLPGQATAQCSPGVPRLRLASLETGIGAHSERTRLYLILPSSFTDSQHTYNPTAAASRASERYPKRFDLSRFMKP